MQEKEMLFENQKQFSLLFVIQNGTTIFFMSFTIMHTVLKILTLVKCCNDVFFISMPLSIRLLFINVLFIYVTKIVLKMHVFVLTHFHFFIHIFRIVINDFYQTFIS